MLNFLVRADNRGPLRHYLREWGQALHGRARLRFYDDLGASLELPAGVYVFCDVDRLPSDRETRIIELGERMATRGKGTPVLNRPRIAFDRFALLRQLHDRGINRFNVYRLDEPRDRLRFPVFLRHATDHEGARSPLIPDETALDAAIDRLAAPGMKADDLLIVEYVDTSIDGVFRKYAAVKVGDSVIAHHVFFSRDWSVKAAVLMRPTAETVAEERAFQLANPHAREVDEIFRLAGIDFGRIDYGIFEGALQVWEINTNPTLLQPRAYYTPEQMPAKVWFSDTLNAALLAIDPERDKVPSMIDRFDSFKARWL